MFKFLGKLLSALGGLLVLITLASLGTVPDGVQARAPQLAFVAGLVAVLMFVGWRLQRGKTLRWLGLLLLPVGLLAVASNCVFAWVDYRLGQREPGRIPGDVHKVWSTRGLVVGGTESDWNGTQNSVESIRRCFTHGAKGVEVDVFFDPEMGGFVVSHDRPYILKEGKLLMLKELLDAVGDDGLFWLDWKKLRHLEPEDFQSALDVLERLTAKGDLRERFYVEGEDPFRIRQARRAGFLTIFDTHPLPDSNLLSPLVTSFYKALYYFGDHTVMGLEGGDPNDLVHGPNSTRILRDVPLFVYHVPHDVTQMTELALQENVRVILPRDQTLDLFGFLP